jgi:multidrug resistance efflux pump
VFVDQGDKVREGDPIVRISARDYRAELDKVEAQSAQKQAELRMLKIGPRHEEIRVARREVETARTSVEHAKKRYDEAIRMHAERLSKAKASADKANERLNYAELNLERQKISYRRNLISRKEYEEAEEVAAVRRKELKEAESELKLVLADDLAELRRDLAVAEGKLKEAQSRLELLLAGSRPEQIDGAQADIARLQAEEQYLQGHIRLTQVSSPASGIVTTPKLKEKLGEYVKKGDLIAEVYELGTVKAEIAIPEKEIADVSVGQNVAVKARAYPDKTFYGKVTSVAPIATAQVDTWSGKTVIVTTELENSALLLKPEMTGHAKIYSGKRRLIEIMTRRLVRFFRVEFWSWW